MRHLLPAFLPLLLILFASLPGCDDPDTGQTEEASFDPAPWVAKGQGIQKEVFSVLSGQLAEAMGQGGVQGAAQYCNLAAYPLTDSLSRNYNADIRRATLQPRNPTNQASKEETKILAGFRQDLLAGREPMPMAVRTEGGVSYFSPIRIQPLCLNCHGITGNDIKVEDRDFLLSLYPKDQATGYALGDLRGIWHIRFRSEDNLRPK